VALSNVDAAYLAGLVDGEGHIGIRWKHNSYTDKWICVPGFGVASTDLAVLLWCRGITGVGNVRRSSVSNPLSQKPGFAWIVGKRLDILWVLQQIVWYMHIKRDVAHLMIEELESYQGPQLQPGYNTAVRRQVHGPRYGQTRV
jgi:hypothetical protein